MMILLLREDRCVMKSLRERQTTFFLSDKTSVSQSRLVGCVDTGENDFEDLSRKRESEVRFTLWDSFSLNEQPSKNTVIS